MILSRSVGSRRSLWMLALIAALVVLPARQNVRGAPSKADRISAAPVERDDRIQARTLTLEQRLALPAVGPFANLTPDQRAQLERLQGASAVTSKVSVFDECLSIALSNTHPAHPFEIVLCGGSDRLVAFSGDRWAYDLPREQLADLLDRSGPSTRDRQGGHLTSSAPSRDLLAGGPFELRTVSLHSEITHRSEGSRAAPWRLRLRLDLAVPATVNLAHASPLLYALVAPPLFTRHGELLLESLAVQEGIPTRWVASITNDSFPMSAAPRFLTTVTRTQVEALAPEHFAQRRSGFRIAHRLPTGEVPGEQTTAPDSLEGLRSTDSGGDLQVRNESRVAAWVYLDGVLLGWVGAGKKLTFAGPNKGYYRIYGASPTGTRSWGPADLYLPGSITLD